MTWTERAARLQKGAAALLCCGALTGAARAEALEPLGGDPAVVEAVAPARPATPSPGLASWPAAPPVTVTGSALPLLRSEPRGLSSRFFHVTLPLRAAAPRPLPGALFSDRLVARMEQEAARTRRESRFDGLPAAAPFAGEVDSIGEELRALEAERIITRAFDHALDDQLERVARAHLGLGPALDWLEGGRGKRAAGEGTAGPAAGGFTSGLGFRIGAHPRLVLRTRFLGVRGRIEVPLLDEPLRLSFDRPLGSRGRVAVTSGLSRDERDWTMLSLHLDF